MVTNLYHNKGVSSKLSYLAIGPIGDWESMEAELLLVKFAAQWFRTDDLASAPVTYHQSPITSPAPRLSTGRERRPT